MIVLDTDTASLAFREHEGVLARLAACSDRVVLSIITRIEILRGRFAAVQTAATAGVLLRAQAGLAKSERFLAGFEIIPIDGVAAEHFDRLKSNKRLKKIGRPDLLIACVALAGPATLVTRNTKDFALVPGLNTENWAD